MDDNTFHIFARKPYQWDEDTTFLLGGYDNYMDALVDARKLWEAMFTAEVSLGYVSIGVMGADGWCVQQFIITDFLFD